MLYRITMQMLGANVAEARKQLRELEAKLGAAP